MTEEDEAFEDLAKRQGYWGMQGSRKHQILRFTENVESKATSMTQIDALKLALDALEQTLQTLDDENAKPGGAIADTIWHSEHETLFDYLGSEITAIKEVLAEHAMRETQRLGQEIEQEPKIGCVNHDCEKCKAQTQEPVETYIHEFTKLPHPGDFGIPKGHWWQAKQYADALYTTPPQRTEPVTDEIASILACRDMLDAQPVPPQPEQEPVAILERDPSIGRLRVTYEDAVTELDEGVYPLYTKPQIEVGCAECGVNGGHALYCVACAEKFLISKAIDHEREECASLDIPITIPKRDYLDMSPLEIYEEALMDATLSFRAAIRARGQA